MPRKATSLSLFFTIFIHLGSISQTRYLDDLFSVVEPSTYVYAIRDTQRLSLDVYQPRGDTTRLRPVMVWMHGGGFSGGNRDNPDEVRFMEAAAKKGYVAVSISYRLLQKGRPEGFGCDCSRARKLEIFQKAAADFMDAVLFVKANKSKFRVDPQKIIVGGSSAGAEAVLNAAFMRDLFFPKEEAYQNLKFAAVLSFAGALVDVRYLTKENAAPTLMFHGTADDLVPYASAPHHYCPPEKAGYLWLDGSETIADKLASEKFSYLLYTFVGARHEISSIPFDHLDLVFGFLKDVAIDQKYRALRLEEK